jgi:outer membrane protein
MNIIFRSCLVALLWVLSLSACAEEEARQYAETHSWVIAASVGIGKLQNPLTEQDDIPLYVLPDIRYYSEKFSIENLGLSYAILEKKGIVIELLGEQNFDGLYFPGEHRTGYSALAGAHPAKPWDLLATSPVKPEPLAPSHRSMSYLAGIEVRKYGWLDTFFSVQKDVSNVHQGYEAKLRLIKPFRLGKWQMSSEASAIYKSGKLANYYYGISEKDTFNTALYYQAAATVNYYLAFNLAYSITERLAMVASVQQLFIKGDIAKSPVVSNESPFGFFLGVKYVL